MKNLKTLLVLLPLLAAVINLNAAGGYIIPNPAPDTATVQLAWTASPPTPGITIQTYRIYYGTDGPGKYTQMAVVGNVTNTTIAGLTRGLTNYFICTAVSTDGLESNPSNEASAKAPLKPSPPSMNSISNLVVQATIQTAPGPDGPWRDILSPEPLQVENPETAAFFRSHLVVYSPDTLNKALAETKNIPKPPLPTK